jgi:hypothetical protein
MANEIDDLRREVAALRRENKATREQLAGYIAENRMRIASTRRSQGLHESAFYFLLAIVASFLVGFVRSPDGSWSFGIKSEIVLALISGGGVVRLIGVMREKEEPQNGKESGR